MLSPSQKLLRWYDLHGRELPWRKTRDPYKILVSEMMLQQTQVARVLLFYRRWLNRFPTWQRLSDATNTEVIRAWAGLGYNRRALMLRDIAKDVNQNGVPQSLAQWQALKGIGAYTAAAICIFAFGKRIMPIDTNIRRVLGRVLLGIAYPQPMFDDQLRRRSDSFLPKRVRVSEVPQALFDLASDICKKIPECRRCPLRSSCRSAKKFMRGDVKIPKQMIKKSVERRHRNKPYPDRIYRGRILKLVREQVCINILTVGTRIDDKFDPVQDQAWIASMIAKLEKEAFITITKNFLRLRK